MSGLLGAVEDQLQWIRVAVIAGYLLVLLYLGWRGHRASSGGEEDYYLAGRQQGWLVSTLTIMATFFSSFALLGAPGMVYREGVVFALVSLNVPVAGFCIYLLGRGIWAAGRRGRHITPADMICEHYGSDGLLRLLVVLVGMLFVVPYVMMQIKAGGDIAAVLFPAAEFGYEWGAVVLATITALYIMVGGMRSVAWTDTLQCVLLLGGMLMAGIAMVASFGGLSGFSRAVSALPASSLTVPGNTGQWSLTFLFSVCILMPIGGIIQPAQWMRFYSVRNPEALRRGALIFIIVLTGCFLLGIMPVGLGGQALYPLRISPDSVAPAPEVGGYDQILVLVTQRQLPELLGNFAGTVVSSLLIVGIMAASMSTADSSLHALSALVTRDVYGRFLRPKSGDAERVWVGRATIVLTTISALALVLVGPNPASSLAGFMEMIVGLALFAVAFSVQLLPITIDMLYLRWGRRWGATLGLAAGLVTAFCFTSLFPLLCSSLIESNTAGLGRLAELISKLKSFAALHAAAWGLLPNVVIFGLISRLERSRNSSAA